MPISTFSALKVFHVVRYINVRYLLTYLLTYLYAGYDSSYLYVKLSNTYNLQVLKRL